MGKNPTGNYKEKQINIHIELTTSHHGKQKKLIYLLSLIHMPRKRHKTLGYNAKNL